MNSLLVDRPHRWDALREVAETVILRAPGMMIGPGIGELWVVSVPTILRAGQLFGAAILREWKAYRQAGNKPDARAVLRSCPPSCPWREADPRLPKLGPELRRSSRR
jgi:hypothetical protein